MDFDFSPTEQAFTFEERLVAQVAGVQRRQAIEAGGELPPPPPPLMRVGILHSRTSDVSLENFDVGFVTAIRALEATGVVRAVGGMLT